MKLTLRSDHPRAYGSRVEIAGVSFIVVSLVKQGFFNQQYWEYEVEIASGTLGEK